MRRGAEGCGACRGVWSVQSVQSGHRAEAAQRGGAGRGGAGAEGGTDLVVVGPRGEGAVHRGLEVAALDERDEEEVLVELVDDPVAQLRVPLPGYATAEPSRVVGILGKAPEVAPASKAVRARDALVCPFYRRRARRYRMYRVGGARQSQLLLHVGVVNSVQPLELPCDRVDLAAEAGLRDGHPARDARGEH